MHKREIRQLICAMTLGDGCLFSRKRGTKFYMAHSKKQEDYLLWKVSLIDSFFEKKGLNRRCKVADVLMAKKYPSIQANLYWKSYLQILHSKIYPQGKKKVDFILKNMESDLHLAIWLMDDGSEERRKTTHVDGSKYTCNPYLRLHTYAFTSGEHELIKQWFESRYNVFPRVCWTAKGGYTRFLTEDSRKLFKKVAPYICQIESMRNKFRLSIERYWPERTSTSLN